MILLDYNAIFLANANVQFYLHKKDMKISHIKQAFLNQIATLRGQFNKEFGEIIICADGSTTWRKDQFIHYKHKRKAAREASEMPWELVFDALHQMRHEVSEHFPYKLLKHDKCEGDDVIAIMSKYFQTNELIDKGLDSVPQPILILSADHDFRQLQVFGNITQYSPAQKKYVIDHDPNRYWLEKIITGDSGDSIPNIKSANDSFVTKTRQKRIMQPFLESIQTIEDVPEEYKERFEENRKLIDLVHDSIPQNLHEEIITLYKSKVNNPRSKIMGYLIKNNFSNLRNQLQYF